MLARPELKGIGRVEGFMKTLGLILAIWCVPSAAILLWAAFNGIRRAWFARQWHLHEAFHAHHIRQ